MQSAVILQRRVERVVHDNKWLLFAGRQAFRSFVRAYATHSMDTKGIFSVQSLHLGHVAKSFGLRESPKALRSSEDVIGKIFNGAYSVLNTRSDNRERFSHSGKGGDRNRDRGDRDAKGGNKNNKDNKGKGGKTGTTVKRSRDDRDGDSSSGNKRQRSDDTSSSSAPRSTQNPGVVVKSGKDRQKLRKMGPSGGGSDRKGSSTSKGSGSKITASGVFRKTTGYFKKKLRSQMSSEFSN